MASAPSAHNLQMEYNFQIAEAVLTAQEAEGRPEAESEQFAGPVVVSEGTDIAGRLHEATRQLAENLAALKEGEDPRPAIQQFLPAALLALQPIIKGVIAIIGRDKVVNFIAGLIAKLISAGSAGAGQGAGARPVVSVGLGMLGFEAAAQQDPRLAAAECLAQTVQETVLHLVQQPPASFEQPNLVQALTMEASTAAGAGQFPERRHAPGTARDERRLGTMAADADLGPPALVQEILPGLRHDARSGRDAAGEDIRRRVAGGEMLGATAGINTDRPLKARIHVYELTIGSRLIDISRFEDRCRRARHDLLDELGPADAADAGGRSADPAAQGAAGLGRDPGPQFLQGAYLTAPGQRFYHIEVPGRSAPGRAAAQAPAARQQIIGRRYDVGIIFNLIRGARSR